MEYKTNRLRTVSLSGTAEVRHVIISKFVTEEDPISNRFSQGEGQVRSPWGSTVGWSTGISRVSGVAVTADDGMGTIDSNNNYVTLPPVTTYQATHTGTWIMNVQVREWVKVEDAFDAGSGGFPTRDGLSTDDGLVSKKITFFEKTEIGGNYYSSISVGGVSASVTTPITDEVPIDYTAETTLQCGSTNSEGWCNCTIDFLSGLDFTPYNFTHTRGKITATPSAGPSGAFFEVKSYQVDDNVGVGLLMGGQANPVRRYDLDLRMRRVGNTTTLSYPSEIVATIRDRYSIDTPVTCNPNGALNIKQRQWVISGEITVGTYTALAPTSSLNEITSVYGFLNNTSTTSLGEDARDRRLQWQVYPFEALTVTQSSPLEISSSATVSSSGPSIPLTESNLESYRYLSFTATRSGFSDDRIMEITLGSKSYKFQLTGGSTNVVIDLCLVSNLPGGFSTDNRDSRYPVSFSGPPYTPDNGVPVLGGSDSDNGWVTHGLLDRPTEVVFSGLEDGESLGVTAIKLSVSNAHIGVMLPFQSEIVGWVSPDYTYIDRDVTTWADFKPGPDWPCRKRSGSTYTFFTLDDLATFIGSPAGMGATAGSAPDFSPYDPEDETVLLVDKNIEAGNLDGYIYSGTAWRDQTYTPITANLYACYKVDEISAYPECGDPTKAFDDTQPAFPLRCSKILRGGAEGLVRDENNVLGGVGTQLVVSATSAIVDSASTNSIGGYRLKDGKGNVGHKDWLSSNHSIFESFLANNRWRGRTSFLGEPAPAGGVHLCCCPYAPIIFSIVSFENAVRVYRWDGKGIDDYVDIYSGTDVDMAQGEWLANGVVTVLFGEGGYVKQTSNYAYGLDGGWSMPETLFPGKNPATAVDSRNNVLFCASYDSGVWKLYTKQPAQDWEYVSDIVSTGTDACAGLLYGPDLQSTLHFHYHNGTDIIRLKSTSRGMSWE